MTEIDSIKEEIEKLKARNRRVEINKAWETSLTRKAIILVFTYIVVGLTLVTIKNSAPWINAIIPTLGFFLSTLTLPLIKEYWRKYIYKR
jgi:hypothetical protein